MQEELKDLLERFNVSKKDFEKHLNYYNNNFDKYDNTIYKDVKTRLVHLKNFSEKNWFNKRYNLLFKKYNLFDSIIEIGFGLPYLPLKKESNLKNLIYVDSYSSAIDVSKEILKKLKSDAVFIKGDAENKNTWSKIKKRINGKKLIVGIEVVEHLKRPDLFWKNAKSIGSSRIIISLPIGPKIPSHTIAFETVKEATKYLSNYMQIEEKEIIKPSKKFKGNLGKYKDLIVFGRLKQ